MHARVNDKKCRRCFICRRYCPIRAITILENHAYVDPERCVGCEICVDACPFGLIQMVEYEGVSTREQ